jgi:hypothetical protein
METTIETFNDRVKWLYQKLGYKSGREFDRRTGIAETNTAGITGCRQITPKIEYVQKILLVHPNVNANWLLIGVGEAFMPDDAIKDSREELIREIEMLKQQVKGLQFGLISAANSVNFQSAVNFKIVSNKKPVSQRIGIIILFIADSIADRNYSTTVIA